MGACATCPQKRTGEGNAHRRGRAWVEFWHGRRWRHCAAHVVADLLETGTDASENHGNWTRKIPAARIDTRK